MKEMKDGVKKSFAKETKASDIHRAVLVVYSLSKIFKINVIRKKIEKADKRLEYLATSVDTSLHIFHYSMFGKFPRSNSTSQSHILSLIDVCASWKFDSVNYLRCCIIWIDNEILEDWKINEIDLVKSIFEWKFGKLLSMTNKQIRHENF